MQPFLRKPLAWGALGIILVGAVSGYIFLGKTTQSEGEIVIAVRKDIGEQVHVTGKVEPAQSVDLAFEEGGKVARVYARVGAKVSAGASLATLENAGSLANLAEAQARVSSAEAALKQYQAALDAQKVKLDEIKRGTRPEEIRLTEIKLENARSAVLDAKKNLLDKMQDAYTKSDDAVRYKADQVFSNPATAPKLIIQASNQQLKSDIESDRLKIESVLTAWNASLATMNARDNVNSVKAFLDKISLLINGLTVSASLSQATIDAYKSDISTARTNINTAIANITAAEEKIKTSDANVLVAEQELAVKKAGSTEDQIRSQEAQVRQAEANVLTQQAQIAQAQASVQSVYAQVGKAMIRAPFAGTVTKVDVKVGQIVSGPTVPVVVLISEADFQIKAGIPEADISKVTSRSPAQITLDAYGSEVVFEGTVTAVDPAETMVDGVATYQTTIQFKDKDERIKSGMTANVNIVGQKHMNVIALPQRAIVTKDGQKVVRVQKGGDEKNPLFEDVLVETGLRGLDGFTEILRGISEGDRVLVSSSAE